MVHINESRNAKRHLLMAWVRSVSQGKKGIVLNLLTRLAHEIINSLRARGLESRLARVVNS